MLEHLKPTETFIIVLSVQRSPVHINDLWEFQFLVYLLRAAELSVEFKSRQFKCQDWWQIFEPSLRIRVDIDVSFKIRIFITLCLVVWFICSPHDQMWRCDLSAETRSPSPPWRLLGIHRGCWSRWPAGGIGRTARCYTTFYLSRVTWHRHEWHVGAEFILMSLSQQLRKTLTFVSSLCHKGTIKKLNHGVLMFIFCVTVSKPWHINVITRERRRVHDADTYFPLAANWKASSSQSSSLCENSLTSWNESKNERKKTVSLLVKVRLMLCIIVFIMVCHRNNSGVWPLVTPRTQIEYQ